MIGKTRTAKLFTPPGERGRKRGRFKWWWFGCHALIAAKKKKGKKKYGKFVAAAGFTFSDKRDVKKSKHSRT